MKYQLSIEVKPQWNFYQPSCESPQTMLEALKPAGKRVANIAAYGGYALWLLHENAASVSSVDISSESILVNKLLRASIEIFDYHDNCRLFQNKHSSELNKGIAEHLGVPEDIVGNYFLEVSKPWRWNARNFPQLNSDESYSRVKTAIRDRRWNISEGELLNWLGERPDKSLDGIYASTVRNWVLSGYRGRDARCSEESQVEIPYNETLESFVREFDSPLANEAYRVLSDEGLFVDVSPPPILDWQDFSIDLRNVWSSFERMERIVDARIVIKEDL